MMDVYCIRYSGVLVGFAALLAGGCFGRTPIMGTAKADGEVGAACVQDGHCLAGLYCINSRCVDLSDLPDQDLIEDRPMDFESSECPGLVGTVSLGSTVSGSTEGQISEYWGQCGGRDAPEDVWLFRLSRTTDVTITTQGSDYDTLIYVRDGCDINATELACNDDDHTTGGLHSRISFENRPPGEYYIFVDGFVSHAGSYSLSVREE